MFDCILNAINARSCSFTPCSTVTELYRDRSYDIVHTKPLGSVSVCLCVVCALKKCIIIQSKTFRSSMWYLKIFVCFMHAKHILETALPALIKWCVTFFAPSKPHRWRAVRMQSLRTARFKCVNHFSSFIGSCFRRIYWYAIHGSLFDFK